MLDNFARNLTDLKDADLRTNIFGPSFMGRLPSDKDIDRFQRRVADAGAADLLRVWLDLAREKQIPARADLGLNQLGAQACHVILAEWKSETRRVFLRLVGTEVTDLAGSEFTGFYLDDVIERSAEMYELSWRAVFEQACPRYAVMDLRQLGRQHRTIGSLSLPLRGNDSSDVQFALLHVHQLKTASA